MSNNLVELGIQYRAHGPVEQRVRCPRCDRGERDDALGINTESGVFHCFRCGWSGRADTGESRGSQPVARFDDPERAERVRARLRQVWRESLPLESRGAMPVRRYLDSRGLGALITQLPRAHVRAHPGLTYWDTLTGRDIGRYPAMVCMFTGADGKPRTLHATFVAHGGARAPVPAPKKILGTPVRGATCGGAIRLFAPRNGRLAVTEGIENALSLVLLHKVPCWAAYCADNLTRVRLPPDVQELYVGVDLDLNERGEDAARQLADRAARENLKLTVRLVIPKGNAPFDLNDELRAMRGAS